MQRHLLGRPMLTAVLAVLLAGAIAACGGGDGDQGGATETTAVEMTETTMEMTETTMEMTETTMEMTETTMEMTETTMEMTETTASG